MANRYKISNKQGQRSYEYAIAPRKKQAMPGDVIEEQDGEARKYFYKILMSITIEHQYYNADNGKSLDFAIYPTAQATDLMRSLGLIFKIDNSNFSVLYNEKSEKNLFRYLKQQNNNDLGYWTKLSLMISVTNSLFVNFSELFFNTNPLMNNFYLSNQQAHEKDNGVILNKNEFINQIDQDYYNVVPVQYEVEFLGATEIEVRSISSELVLCFPSCVPKGLVSASRGKSITCLDGKLYLEKFPKASCEERNSVYIDFSSLAEGLYSISWLDADKTILFQEKVVYTLLSINPLLFVDLLLSAPEQSSAGIFPVDLELDTINTINYQMIFNQRSTYWIYWVVVKNSEIKKMEIVPERNNHFQFGQQHKGHLAGGVEAYWFVSNQPIPLQSNPTYFFSLLDITDPDDRHVLQKPLNVASAKQVVTKKFLTIDSADLRQPTDAKYSEILIYV